MICYVILHYKNIEDTEKCIASLQNIAGVSSHYIIVDNGSNDGSGEQLKSKYQNVTNCDVLLLPTNLGFSKGNNVGYRYAEKKYSPDYIVVTNNDVVFYQLDFESKIEDIFLRSHFYVLGPDIYIPRHKDHQSPLFKKGITTWDLEHEIEEYRYYRENPDKFEKRLLIHAFKNMICSKSNIINVLYGIIRNKESLDYRKEYEGVGLQGSCLIFSRLFIDREEKAFDPEPFLYEEEVFLFYRCQRKGYKMLYSPEIGIRHEEGASFNHGDKSKDEKVIFMLEQHIKAREELLDYLKEESVKDEKEK